MFFCTLLLCQVSLAQQTAHVEGALLLGEKRSICAGAGRASRCSSKRRRLGWLAGGAWAPDPPRGMRGPVVATGLLQVINALSLAYGSGKSVAVNPINPCSQNRAGEGGHGCHCLSRAGTLGPPVTPALAGLHVGENPIRRCPEAPRPAAGGRSALLAEFT